MWHVNNVPSNSVSQIKSSSFIDSKVPMPVLPDSTKAKNSPVGLPFSNSSAKQLPGMGSRGVFRDNSNTRCNESIMEETYTTVLPKRFELPTRLSVDQKIDILSSDSVIVPIVLNQNDVLAHHGDSVATP